MDPRIQAAIIAAVSAFVGVILGGIIQSSLKNREIIREKMVAEGAVALYLCQLRFLFVDFSNEEETYKALSLGITANENNISEVDKIISLIEKHDPFLVVRLFRIKQLLHNIGNGSRSYWEQIKKNSEPKLYTPIVSYINVDGKRGIKETDECIKHSFNYSENQTKKYLLQDEDFKGFIKSIIGNGLYQRLKIKFKLVSKI